MPRFFPKFAVGATRGCPRSSHWCVEGCEKGEPVIDEEGERNVALLSLIAHSNTVPTPVTLRQMLSRIPPPIALQ